MDLDKYRALYLSETQENLEKISRLLVQMEQSPGDRGHIDNVFRLFHSIKGMSGTMGYLPMFDLAHQLEELMDRLRRGSRRTDGSVVDVLLAGVDRMTQWVQDVEANRLPLRVDEASNALHDRIDALVDRPATGPLALDATPSPLPASARDGAQVLFGAERAPTEPSALQLTVEAEPDCPDPGIRALLLLRRLARLGRVESVTPDALALRAPSTRGPVEIRLATRLSVEQLKTYLGLLVDWPKTKVELAEPSNELLFTGDLFELDLADEQDVFCEGCDEADASIERTPEPFLSAVLDPASSMEASSEAGRTSGRSVRVRTEWLDQILGRLSDLVVQSQRILARRLGENVLDLELLAHNLAALHDDALEARALPFGVLTQHLPRVVRDMSRQAGKRATLTVQGEDQALDRALIEGLDAALAHLIRNAIEHGIEPSPERVSVGKNPSGCLHLTCLRDQRDVVVELSDDGRGIDQQALTLRALQLELWPQAAPPPDLMTLICLPGLTSRRRPDDLGGRGVGMDAVASSVTALGGRLGVTSSPGQGTTFRLTFPARSPNHHAALRHRPRQE